MRRMFVLVAGFERKWNAAGLDDEALRALQDTLLLTPEAGAVIVGTQGVRKLRWARPGQGKSGGVRVFYVDFPVYGVLYLLTLLQKNDASNLERAERNALGALVLEIERALQARVAKRSRS